MEYFGIKTPKKKNQESYISWFSKSEYGAWIQFFSRSEHNKSDVGGIFPNGVTLVTAIRAYAAIGYKCVAVNITEK